MDDYPYAVLGPDGWLHCDGLHRPSFPTLLRDVLHRFHFTGTPAYHGHLYRKFRHGRCEVHVDIPTHPSDLSLTAWFTTATGDDFDDTRERATHRALMEFCESHLSGLDDTANAFLPIWDLGNSAWSECLATACDLMLPTYHTGWAFMQRYTRHVSSLLQEVTAVGTHQRLCLEEYDHQVEAKDSLNADITMGNRELLQQNHILEMHNKELNDELMRIYCNRDFKTDALNSTRTQLQHTQDELTLAHNYVYHLEAELVERDQQLEASQARVEEL
jgi:hypothetical protein